VKDRLVQCIHYVCEGICDLGKDGSFNAHCQTCKTYKKKPNVKGKPNAKRQKMERAIKKEKLD